MDFVDGHIVQFGIEAGDQSTKNYNTSQTPLSPKLVLKASVQSSSTYQRSANGVRLCEIRGF